ncbi:hypothetical protein EOM89_00065 [Candidatus Falkowbacteria bacterium]|nr:hypothetical protein [Candidatus Falkowbacteria bacterium]
MPKRCDSVPRPASKAFLGVSRLAIGTIDRAEIRILDRDRSSRGLAVVPVAPNGTAGWTMPADGADEMLFALRVYDAGGRFDETHHQALNRTAANFPAVALDGPIIAPGEDLDMPVRRGIAVRGGAVTVTGSETTGVADNRVVGADILLRRSDATWLSLDVARSEGPGFGASFSDNGGLDIDSGGEVSAGPKGRLGLGASARLTERVRIEGEASDGSLGAAGAFGLTYDKTADTQYTLGYRLDPLRREDSDVFSGRDRGTWVLGAISKVNDQVAYRFENKMDLKGQAGSVSSSYGVRYTPSDRWSYDLGLELGEYDETTGGTFTRKGISAALAYRDGERFEAGLKGEFLRDTSTSDPERDRRTLLASAYTRYRVSEDWRLLANLDALVSDSDQASVRDGRYIEANVGYAYRPVANDRLNALLRYTYLYDMPGADQVNIAGDTDGPLQKSHIFSVDVNYDLTKDLTLGAKYGLRKAQIADRSSDLFIDSTADLWVVRLDYHVVHNWDVMIEARRMDYRDTGVTETGALAGVWRHVGNNLKVGAGYQWGDVSDDLRLIEGRKEGAFLNLVAKF